MSKDSGAPFGNRLSSSTEPASGLGPSGFDPARFGGPYAIPWPPKGARISLNIIRRPKTFGLWWALLDSDGWFDGGHISSHRSIIAAQTKAKLVADYLASRDSDGPRMAETVQLARGEAGPARAEGIAQNPEPKQ